MAFADNNNVLCGNEFELTEASKMVCQLLENKRSGALSINLREFFTKGSYTGPGKNGMFLKINSLEELESFQKELNVFFDNAKQHLV